MGSSKVMDQFINKEAAMRFKDEVQDPIVRELLLRAYGTLVFQVAPTEVGAPFDLLFFFRVMEAFLRNREGLAKALLGEEDTTEAGNHHPCNDAAAHPGPVGTEA